jgi:hypothetical protein
MEAHLKDNPGHGSGLLMDYALRPLSWGKTRAWRVYTALKLNLPRRGKRRLPARIRTPLEIPLFGKSHLVGGLYVRCAVVRSSFPNLQCQ